MGFGKKEWIESEILRKTEKDGPLPEIKEVPGEYRFHGSIQSAMAERTGIWSIVTDWSSVQYSRILTSKEGGYNVL